MPRNRVLVLLFFMMSSVPSALYAAGTGPTVDVASAGGATVTPERVVIPNGFGSGSLGYLPGREDEQPRGVQDFALDAVGDVIILDDIDAKLMRLGPELAVEKTEALPERFTSIRTSADGSELLLTPLHASNPLRLSVDGSLKETAAPRGEGAALSAASAAPAVQSVKKGPQLFELTVTTDGSSSVWTLNFDADVFAAYPLSGEPVEGRIYLRVDYLVSPSPLELKSVVLVFDREGNITARLELEAPGEARLRNDAKVGPDGSVVQIIIHESGTDVLKWSL